MLVTVPKEPKPHPYLCHPTKVCYFLFWIFSLFVVFLIIKDWDSESWYSGSSRPFPVEPENICKSPECITLAQQLHNWQDISVDPCQDFYRAACGKYSEHTLVKESRFNKVTKIIYQLVTEHLDKNLPTTSKSETAMKAYYQKCKETALLNVTETKAERLREVYRNIQKIGSWPMVDKNWEEGDFDLNSMLHNMASLGKANLGFFTVTPSEDSHLEISLEGALAELDQFFQRLGVKTFNKFLDRIFEVNNIEFDKRMTEDVGNFVNFAQFLAGMNKPSETETVGFDGLQKQIPSVDLEGVFKLLMRPGKREETWKAIVGKVIAKKNGYFFNETQNLETILRVIPKRTLANYLILTYVVSEGWKGAVEEMEKSCASLTINIFPLAALRIFVRNHFDKENLEIASKMVEDVRSSFIEMIQESTWLSEKTKMSAIRKAEMMKKMVGYPKELEIPGALDSFYETLMFSPEDSFYKYNMVMEKFEIEQAIDFVAASLPMHSHQEYFQANAFYAPTFNRLTLNVPFLDDPFFDSTYPAYAKIASIGEVLGHEIGHGFDPNGRNFDENGNVRSWWTPEDSAEYDRRTQCLVDQYSNYNDPDFGRNLNGTITIREVAADLIGITTSWRTYKKLDLTNEPKIIGFEDYHPDKLFYRLTALNWCRSRDETPLAVQQMRSHPTMSFRVNGIFSNMKSFAEAYSCPVGSPMNPEKKCELF